MKNSLTYFLLVMFLLAQSCNSPSAESDETRTAAKTPVTVCTVEHLTMTDYLQLSGTTSYLKKNQVKATTTGYVVKSFAHIGDFVQAGKPLFYIQTKEAAALNKYHSDSTYTIRGSVVINAPESGIITEMNKYANDYVNDGDNMATIAQQSSFVVLMNVPFEMRKYSPIGSSCFVVLPDSSRIPGTIVSQLSSVDPVSQTQNYEVRVSTKTSLPENLIVGIRLVKSTKPNAQAVTQSSVLSDETMDNFWVMKLINDTTAVKVFVKKGITSNGKVEIISPQFNTGDRIILSGHYGLPDTARITINK